MISVHIQTDGFAQHRGHGGYAPLRPVACVVQIDTHRRQAAPAPQAGQLATGLEAPISDGRRPHIPTLAAVEADRGFSAGNGYLTGLIVNRCA